MARTAVTHVASVTAEDIEAVMGTRMEVTTTTAMKAEVLQRSVGLVSLTLSEDADDIRHTNHMWTIRQNFCLQSL